MGWMLMGAEGHEGYVALVLDDGRSTTTTDGDGPLVRVTRDDRDASARLDSGGQYVAVPWERVEWWRVQCGCGWVGPARRAHDVDGTRDVPTDVEDALYPAWSQHLAPIMALVELGALRGERQRIEDATPEVVRAARRGGASWAQIGEALGITKQAAQQRYGAAQ